jgi:hypothetical protein
MTDRCPSCGATVRAGDPWCTLCWTDLRPKPAPPPAPPVPVPAAPAAPGVAPRAAVATVDPLTAPLHALLDAPPATQAADEAPRASWPCVECGAANALDLDACGTCTAPFGGRILRTDLKETRRKVWIVSIAVVLTFLALLAGLTLAMTGDPVEPPPVPIGNDGA